MKTLDVSQVGPGARRYRAAVVGAVAALTIAGGAQATSVAKVTGDYAYTSPSGPKTVSVDARGTDPSKGIWTFTNELGVSRGGPITCLVVDGSDAWMAGPGMTGDAGAFLYIHDEGSPGRDDLAVTWIQDPGQPFADLQGWCEAKATHVERYTLDSGNVVIHKAP